MPSGATDDTSRLVDNITDSLRDLDKAALESSFEAHRLKYGNRLFVGPPGVLPAWYRLDEVEKTAELALAKLIDCNSSMERSRLGKNDGKWKECLHIRIFDEYTLLKKPNLDLIRKRFKDYQSSLEEYNDAKRRARLEKAKLAQRKAREEEEKSEQDRIARVKAEEDFLKTPEGMKSQACEAHNEYIKLAELIQDEPQRLMKQGIPESTINRVLAARLIVAKTISNRRDAWASDYQKVSGAKINFATDCK
jgi:hypothetical protein